MRRRRGSAVIDGPLRQDGAEVVLVASSFAQATASWARDVVAYLGDRLNDRTTWRKRDNNAVFEIEHLPTRARLKAVGSDPRRMHMVLRPTSGPVPMSLHSMAAEHLRAPCVGRIAYWPGEIRRVPA